MRIALFALVLLGALGLTLQMGIEQAGAAIEEGAAAVPAAPEEPAAEGQNQPAHGQRDLQQELGRILSPWTVIPFVILLLSIALVPLIHGRWWESNLNKGAVSALCGLPIAAYLFWIGPSGIEVLAEILKDYYAFIILLVALFTISGGIYLEGDLRATPLVNTAFLGLGAVLASFIGTTGAAMLLIRPLLNTNRERKIKKHIFVFAIFVIANIGGSLLPVGDPPLFLGYLFGVPFFWTLRLFPLWAAEIGMLLTLFFVWDTWAYSRERPEDLRRDVQERTRLEIRGALNIVLILAVLCSVVFLKDYRIAGYEIHVAWMQQPAMILLALISYVLDHKKKEKARRGGDNGFQTPREKNAFTFYPMIEVAVLFIGIFITMTPAICLLKAHGAETNVTEPWQFFWMSGFLSSFLDNAPTYATYFALGQGVTQGLMASASDLPVVASHTGPIAEGILMAVSAGSVFMGANTYIGNAPNFMVRSICEEAKVKMPSFFGYMLFSGGILIPSFLVITYLFFR
ncbi:MAG: sodium:proton antiporter [bacterium]